MRSRPTLPVFLLLAWPALAWAQPGGGESLPGFGMEFEFAGNGNRIVRFEEMPFKNYERILRGVVEHYGGDPSEIRRVDFTKPTTNLEKYPEGVRPLFKATWKDPRGRTWILEPEFVASSGFDGYELVTPPMDDPREMKEVLERVWATGAVREGRRSGVHLTVDASRLIKANGNARALANLIIMHENMEPMLRRMFNPVRGGGHANYFARSIAVDHADILREIDALSPRERTKARLEKIFRERNAKEARLHEVDLESESSRGKSWKYRSMNLAKALNINEMHNGNAGVVEFRMLDLSGDPEMHRLQAELYRRMIAKAEELAARGETVKYQPRKRMPKGENPVDYNTPKNVEEARIKAREMVEFLGLDPVEYERVIEENVRPREHRSATEFERVFERLPTGRVLHNGKPFTYGFELEGRGSGFVNIAEPLDPATRRRWSRMSEAEKKAYFEQVTGGDPKKVDRHFRPDTRRFPWIDPDWKVEKTGNWEIRSTVFENLEKAANAMRRVQDLTGKSAKGFHMHMRDNAPDWERLESRSSEFSDFLGRSGDWVYLKRVERLRTDLSLKSWSNARMSPESLNSAAELAPTLHSAVRISHLDYGTRGNDFIDLEIRGFSTYVDDIERLARLYTHALKTGEFGTTRHMDNVLPSANGAFVPEGLEMVEHLKEYHRRVTGETMSPEKARIIEGLNLGWVTKSGKDLRSYASGVGTPLLPWHQEGSLTEVERRTLRFHREEYLGWLDRYANRIADGEMGLELNLASEKALMELGLTKSEARALIEYRRANGGRLSPHAAARAVALRGGSRTDMSKLARLDAVDLENADRRLLERRLGIDASSARDLIAYRDAHAPGKALELAGFNAAERRELERRARAMDLGDERLSAKELAERTGISEETARRVLAYRSAHEVRTRADLRKAGLSEAEIDLVLGKTAPALAELPATAAELAELLGISQAEARRLLAAAEARRLRSFNDLREAGLSDAARDRVRRAVRTLDQLNTLSVEEIAERAELTETQAEKLKRYRDAHDLRDLNLLKEVLGAARGNKAFVRLNGMNLSHSSYEALRANGVKADVARRIVNYRDAHQPGRSSEWVDFNPWNAAEELRRAKVIEANAEYRFAEALETVDLETANKAELTSKRMGLSAERAEAFLGVRNSHRINDARALERFGFSEADARSIEKAAEALDPKTATLAEIMERTGLSRAEAQRLKALARVDLKRATVEDLTRAGVEEARAERIVAFRDAAANAEGLNYSEAVRKLRLRVRKWVRESGLSDAVLRSLLPKPEAELRVTRNPGERGEGFSTVRRGAKGEFVPSRMSYADAAGIFASVKSGAGARVAERLATAENEAVRGNLRAGAETLSNLKLEIVETNNILAERAGESVRVSTGLLNELHTRAEALPAAERPFARARMLGLVLAHEAGHASGLAGEKLADAEAIRILDRAEGLGRVLGVRVPVEAAEIRGTVEAFTRPNGASRLDNLLNRVRSHFRYGSPEERIERLERVARGEEVDRLAEFRRADGTLDWKRLTRSRVLKEGAGLAHFGLALFLKELAVVVQTGDRVRIEEFFDGLMTTDFYKHYGLFVAGARIGEVAYVRYLQRYIKPRFVNGILKSNLVLATGLALPMIAEGTFEGKAFAISLGSLGLSSAAVKSGVAGIKWVKDLKKARQAGTVGRAAAGASRLARLGGWFYTAVELAVILYLAEDIEHRVNAYLELQKAREALAEAGRAFAAAVGDPNATEESVRAATEAYHAAWTAYRDYLYAPLHQEEALFAARLETVSRQAKLAADKRKAALERVESRPSLAAWARRRYGSVDGYAQHLVREDEAELAAEVEKFAKSYEMNRERILEDVYEGNRRGGALLEDGLSDWSLLGGRTGAAGDPSGTRSDLFARLARDRARSALDDAHERASQNRLQTYRDERELLEATRAALSRSGREDLAAVIAETQELVGRTEQLDTELAGGDGVLDASAGHTGAASALEDATRE